MAIAQKEKIRLEVIERIRNGRFDNGIAPLIESIGGLNEEEAKYIAFSWLVDFNLSKDIIDSYGFDLKQLSIEEIKLADQLLLDKKKAKKLEDNRQRILKSIEVFDENGIAPLIESIDELNDEETNNIIAAWYFYDLFSDRFDYVKIIALYEEALKSNNLEKIRENDAYFRANKENFSKKLGRG